MWQLEIIFIIDDAPIYMSFSRILSGRPVVLMIIFHKYSVTIQIIGIAPERLAAPVFLKVELLSLDTSFDSCPDILVS